MWYICEMSLTGFNKPTFLFKHSRPFAWELGIYIKSEFVAAIKKENVYNCDQIQLITVCSSYKFFISSPHHNQLRLSIIYIDIFLTNSIRNNCLIFYILSYWIKDHKINFNRPHLVYFSLILSFFKILNMLKFVLLIF